MAINRTQDERGFYADEHDVVTQLRQPKVQQLPGDALGRHLRRLRELRNRAACLSIDRGE